MTKSIAYIICMNDGTEAVVIDDGEFANDILEEYKKNHKKNIIDTKDYDDIYYWHLHKVPVYECSHD